MVVGSAVGIVMGRSRLLDEILDGWVVIGLNMPALVTIVICYVWFGLNEVAANMAVTGNKAQMCVDRERVVWGKRVYISVYLVSMSISHKHNITITNTRNTQNN